MALKPSHQGVIPAIQSQDCDKHITWLKEVFNAKQTEIYHRDQKVIHCALIMNNGYLYLCDRLCSMEEQLLTEKEQQLEPRGVVLHVECEDPSIFWKKALANGASVVQDLKMQNWGGVYGQLIDPFGFKWGLMKGGECRKPGVIPYLMVQGCEEYLEWVKKALGGVVKGKFVSEKGLVQHCTVEFNGGVFYMAETDEDVQNTLTHVICHVNVANPTTTWDALKQNGASSVVDLKVQYWGDLYGSVRDSKGFYWSLCEDQSGQKKARGVLPYLTSPACKEHVAWIESVLGGHVEELRHTETGKVMHCKMTVNGGTLMLSDHMDMSQSDKPVPISTDSTAENKTCRQNGFILHLNVSDPDAIWKKAMGNGGIEIVPLKNQFWGDYYGQFQDPFGYVWSVLKDETP